MQGLYGERLSDFAVYAGLKALVRTQTRHGENTVFTVILSFKTMNVKIRRMDIWPTNVHKKRPVCPIFDGNGQIQRMHTRIRSTLFVILDKGMMDRYRGCTPEYGARCS